MGKVGRRIGIAVAAFVVAWLAIAVAAIWLFGSGNVLVYVLAAVVGIGVYLAMWWRERSSRGP